jgi:hypothetical protein
MAALPYRTISNSGAIIDASFELHELTGDAKHVALMLSAVMSVLDRQISPGRQIANGDVLQALAMALALRAEMLPAAPGMKHDLARQLLERALVAMAGARHGRGGVGHA